MLRTTLHLQFQLIDKLIFFLLYIHYLEGFFLEIVALLISYLTDIRILYDAMWVAKKLVAQGANLCCNSKVGQTESCHLRSHPI